MFAFYKINDAVKCDQKRELLGIVQADENIFPGFLYTRKKTLQLIYISLPFTFSHRDIFQ